MTPTLEHTIALLERTPGTLDELLRGLAEEWTAGNEGGDSWSPREIVGHLSHAERTDWMPRMRHLLQFGESEPFPLFDRLGQRREMEGKGMGELLAEFAALRAASLEQLRELNPGPAKMNRRGMHPTLGPVTLEQMLATWAAHDLTHLHQVARVLAYPYRDLVGPWIQFLGVMQCTGHGS